LKKIIVDSSASVGIIVRAKNPEEIFAEIKDDGYPIKLFQRLLNVIGGNWIGEAAKTDLGTSRHIYTRG